LNITCMSPAFGMQYRRHCPALPQPIEIVAKHAILTAENVLQYGYRCIQACKAARQVRVDTQ
jgi:hypothetical protein